MRYIFCNVGWMESYQGNRKSDFITGGGAFVDEEGTGHEVCNFYSCQEDIYGYVQPSRGQKTASAGQIKIENIRNSNASKEDDALEDILVIWTSTKPEGGTVVIGWYTHATIYRNYQSFSFSSSLHSKNGINGYRIKAKAKDAKLLPIDQRTIEIPRRTKGSIGQSNVWYGDSEIGRKLVRRVVSLISGKLNRECKKKKKTTDPKHNSKVEKAAVKVVTKYYEDNNYFVSSVEKDNIGWDLEAISGKTRLIIEVKGLSGIAANVQLTPNEYKAFNVNSSFYRLAVVTNALKKPSLLICRFSNEECCWKVDSESSLKVKIAERIGAEIKICI